MATTLAAVGLVVPIAGTTLVWRYGIPAPEQQVGQTRWASSDEPGTVVFTVPSRVHADRCRTKAADVAGALTVRIEPVRYICEQSQRARVEHAS